jgi:hypothetical protein
MRIGNLEIPGGLLVMPTFVLVIAVFVLWSCYYYSRQKSEMQSLASSRGWKFLGKDSPELRLWLEEMDADTDRKGHWRPENIILVEGTPDRVYLFNYQATTYPGRASSEHGTACLAERPDGQTREPVMIYHRSRLLGKLEEKLTDDKVEVGGPEFRREFLVRSRRPGIAAATVTSGMQQEVLLRQTSSLKWNRVWIAGRRVLVTVTLPLKPEEWDELLGITTRLRAALP